MRNIKFRAKRLDNKQWTYGYLFLGKTDEKAKYAFILKDDLYVDDENIPDGNVLFTSSEVAVVDINTVGQFTGLQDKKGKDIYEGDLIIRKGMKGIGHVYFFQGSFYADFDGFTMRLSQLVEFYDIRVVGVTYQTTE